MRDIGTHYDAVIVGARCAGAATAMLLARAGVNVLVVDRQKYGTDTLSTHALMRAGVLQLHRWELLDRLVAAETPAIARTTFHYGAEVIPVDIKVANGVSHLYAPRRIVLDRILVDAAQEVGAEIRHGVSLTGLRYDIASRVNGVYLKDRMGVEVAVGCDIVIGADGRQSMVARQTGAMAYSRGTGASGYVYGYYDGLPEDGTHWYFEQDVAAGVIPTNGDQHCVFAAVPQGRFAETFRGDLERGLRQIAAVNDPALRDALDGARLDGKLRGFSGGAGYMRQSHGPGWALVGDAGYFKDPLTAHGITDAFRDAELLAHAVLAGSDRALAEYQELRDTLSSNLFGVTDAIASFTWTLDEVKVLHGRLSDAMKREAGFVAGLSSASNLAA